MGLRASLGLAFLFVLAGLNVAELPGAGPKLSGDAVIRAPANGSEIVITTTQRLAGAIHSITWNGQEFIDSADHGRQLQSACSFGPLAGFVPETYNPTEAGTRRDGAGPKSSSRLRAISARGVELRTSIQMAYWLAPGERSAGELARNSTILSDHVVSKRVRIGTRDMPNVLDYEVTFTVPPGERNPVGQFEALTGYMPQVFSRFWVWHPGQKALQPLSDGPGEQAYPIVLSTESGSHAMGIISPGRLANGRQPVTYGRFRFEAEKVVKWNCVFRVRDAKGVPPGDYRLPMYVPIGSRADVEKAIARLWAEFPGS